MGIAVCVDSFTLLLGTLQSRSETKKGLEKKGGCC